MRRLATAARSQSGSHKVPEDSGRENGMNSGSPARAPDARTLTRQRPIVPVRPIHCFSTSSIRDGRKTRKLLPRCGVRNRTKPLESTGRVAVEEARVETIPRSSSSISPSLKARTFFPTPPCSRSGGWPKRMMNSSLSCGSTDSLPITETTTLAEISASSPSMEKSSLLKRHFSSFFPECETSWEASSPFHIRQDDDAVLDGSLLQVFRPRLPPHFELGVIACLLGVRLQDQDWRFIGVALFHQSGPLGDSTGVCSPGRKLNALNGLSGPLTPQGIDPQMLLVGEFRQCGKKRLRSRRAHELLQVPYLLLRRSQ